MWGHTPPADRVFYSASLHITPHSKRISGDQSHWFIGAISGLASSMQREDDGKSVQFRIKFFLKNDTLVNWWGVTDWSWAEATRPYFRCACREPLKPPWRRSAEKGNNSQHLRDETFRNSWPESMTLRVLQTYANIIKMYIYNPIFCESAKWKVWCTSIAAIPMATPAMMMEFSSMMLTSLPRQPSTISKKKKKKRNSICFWAKHETANELCCHTDLLASFSLHGNVEMVRLQQNCG